MKKFIITTILFCTPLVSFAVDTPKNFKELIGLLLRYINAIIPVLIGVAVLVFMWGIAQFVFNAGNTEVSADAKQKMFWGVISLFVIVSIWGLVRFIGDSVGLSTFINARIL